MINDLWYKNAVIYCLSVGTFMDANGDGIGDFQGLMRRLDYLHGLGVTAIWLMPFQTSPCRDDGYDISDYYGVDPRYGTLGDFVEFTHGAKQRGIRVMIDLVVNHTSDRAPVVPGGAQGPEFEIPRLVRLVEEEAAERQRGHGLPRRAEDDLDATTRSPRPITSTASTISSPTSTPSNPEVQAEILKIMGFWIQLGVSGFRMDAVPFVIAHQGRRREEARRAVRHAARPSASSCSGAQGDAIMLAEANVLPETDMEYFGDDGDRMHMMFNFQVNQHLFYALAAADTRPARQGAEGDASRGRRPRNGACSCATTTSSISAA